MTHRFEGKVAIVTGGGSGIGRETAVRLASEGAHVIIANRSETQAAGTLERVAQTGGSCRYIKTDVGSNASVRNLIDEAVRQYGRLDIIVHSAAIESLKNVVELTEDEWEDTIRVNLSSAFYLGKYAIPHLIKSNGGAFINVASVHAHATIRNHAAYSASKGGMLALTKSMAIDFAEHGVRVNAVLPGATDTGMLNRWAKLDGQTDSEPKLAWKDAQPLGRIGEPEEIAALICFLASDEAKFIIGSGFVIDGGMLAQL
ncbi:SDR family NAD(P)-dependent oxidoreductase [Cohnella abietis]|uniref:Short-chain dehydrogenase n=1 Tax=Cohnella abietis TaxID=2507935 RepID=A0A3T1DBW9_9BACL|nr:glucose 1-dehydrogenase [Cohnella abietis]BBI35468.1 short-chain dehydrogenase [Cohnella abietis]